MATKLKYNPISGNFDFVGGGLDFEYEKTNYINFSATAFVTTTVNLVVDALRFSAIEIKEDVTIADLSIGISTANAGASVFGLYDSIDGTPNNLLFQSTAFDNGVTGTQVYTLPSPYSLKSGTYYLCHHSNSTPILRAIPATAMPNILGAILPVNNSNTEIRKTVTYTGTLPANFAAIGGATSYFHSNVPNVLFTIS